MLTLGVLVSGGGTNLRALIDSIETGNLPDVEISVVVSSKKDAYALKRAEKHNINTCILERKNFAGTDEYDLALIKTLEKYQIDLVVLAGFMVIIGNDFIARYRNRIINVHPSLIPAFCGKGYYGLEVHKKALEYGVKISGATVHFVDEIPDGGPVILQKAVAVNENDSPESLQKRIMQEAEWKILPEAVKLISEGRVRIEGRKVKISDDYVRT